MEMGGIKIGAFTLVVKRRCFLKLEFNRIQVWKKKTLKRLQFLPEDTITCGLDKELWVFTFLIDCKNIANFRGM